MRYGRNISSYENNYGPHQPNKLINFRFLISGKMASILTGNRGQRIQSLINKYKCRISISECKSPERVFSMDCSIETCRQIWTECLPSLKDLMRPESFKYPEEIELRLLYHTGMIGAIIGRAGSKVQESRLAYKLSAIRINTEKAPLSTDQVVQIVGPLDNICDYLETISKDMEKQSIRGPIENYNPDNYNKEMFQAYGGWPPENGQNAMQPSFDDQDDGFRNQDTDNMDFEYGDKAHPRTKKWVGHNVRMLQQNENEDEINDRGHRNNMLRNRLSDSNPYKNDYDDSTRIVISMSNQLDRNVRRESKGMSSLPERNVCARDLEFRDKFEDNTQHNRNLSIHMGAKFQQQIDSFIKDTEPFHQLGRWRSDSEMSHGGIKKNVDEFEKWRHNDTSSNDKNDRNNIRIPSESTKPSFADADDKSDRDSECEIIEFIAPLSDFNKPKKVASSVRENIQNKSDSKKIESLLTLQVGSYNGSNRSRELDEMNRGPRGIVSHSRFGKIDESFGNSRPNSRKNYSHPGRFNNDTNSDEELFNEPTPNHFNVIPKYGPSGPNDKWKGSIVTSNQCDRMKNDFQSKRYDTADLGDREELFLESPRDEIIPPGYHDKWKGSVVSSKYSRENKAGYTSHYDNKEIDSRKRRFDCIGSARINDPIDYDGSFDKNEEWLNKSRTFEGMITPKPHPTDSIDKWKDCVSSKKYSIENITEHPSQFGIKKVDVQSRGFGIIGSQGRYDSGNNDGNVEGYEEWFHEPMVNQSEIIPVDKWKGIVSSNQDERRNKAAHPNEYGLLKNDFPKRRYGTGDYDANMEKWCDESQSIEGEVVHKRGLTGNNDKWKGSVSTNQDTRRYPGQYDTEKNDSWNRADATQLGGKYDTGDNDTSLEEYEEWFREPMTNEGGVIKKPSLLGTYDNNINSVSSRQHNDSRPKDYSSVEPIRELGFCEDKGNLEICDEYYDRITPRDREIVGGPGTINNVDRWKNRVMVSNNDGHSKYDPNMNDCGNSNRNEPPVLPYYNRNTLLANDANEERKDYTGSAQLGIQNHGSQADIRDQWKNAMSSNQDVSNKNNHSSLNIARSINDEPYGVEDDDEWGQNIPANEFNRYKQLPPQTYSNPSNLATSLLQFDSRKRDSSTVRYDTEREFGIVRPNQPDASSFDQYRVKVGSDKSGGIDNVGGYNFEENTDWENEIQPIKNETIKNDARKHGSMPDSRDFDQPTRRESQYVMGQNVNTVSNTQSMNRNVSNKNSSFNPFDGGFDDILMSYKHDGGKEAPPENDYYNQEGNYDHRIRVPVPSQYERERGNVSTVNDQERNIVPLMNMCPVAGNQYMDYCEEEEEGIDGLGGSQCEQWRGARNDKKMERNSMEVTIPRQCLVALGGVSGGTVSKIMGDSGADIVVSSPVIDGVSDSDSDSDPVIVTIHGTMDQIEGAQYLLQMCIVRSMLNV